MNRKLLIIALVFTFSQSFAQKNLRIGLYYQPGVSSIANRTEWDNNIKGSFYKGSNFSNYTSVTADYRIKGNIRILCGIGYQNLGYETHQLAENFEPGYWDALLPAFPELEYWTRTEYNVRYLFYSIPVGVRYDISISEKYTLDFCGSLEFNYCDVYYFTAYSYYTNQPKKYDIRYIDFNDKLMYSFSLGVGLNYNLSNKFQLVLQPTVNYFLSKLYKIQPLNGNYLNLGVRVGIIYEFNNRVDSDN